MSGAGARRRSVRGRALLLGRLAVSDLRHHVAEAILLVVAIAAAITVLTLAFALNGVNANPFGQTMAATNGPDVVAQASNNPSTGTTSAADLAALVALDGATGVTAHSGPYPIVGAEGPVGPTLQADGLSTTVVVEGRTLGPARVDQPKVTDGTWIRPGGVVVERSFAQAAHIEVGESVRLDGRPFTVDGIAVTAAFRGFPGTSLIWTTEPAAIALASTNDPLSYVLNLKLVDGSAGSANAFANAFGSGAVTMKGGPSTSTTPSLLPWTQSAYADAAFLRSDQEFLFTGSVLLGILALASVAVLVGGRLAQGTRRVGLLKSVGSTPSLVAATFLVENLFLALIAAIVGLLVGWRVGPLVSKPEADLVGAPGAPPLTVIMVGFAIAVALVVALASTLVPALRAARTSTVQALSDTPRIPKRRSSLIRWSEKLPLPALFGLRLVARRPRRAVLSAASVAVAVMGLVAALSIHAAVDRKFARSTLSAGLVNPDIPRAEAILTAITIALLALAGLTAIFAAWATVLEARRSSAVTLAVGATLQQVRAGVAMAQVIPSIPGAILGLPLGLVLFYVTGHSLRGLPPALWMVGAVVGMLVVVSVLTTVPARIGLRGPVAELLEIDPI